MNRITILYLLLVGLFCGCTDEADVAPAPGNAIGFHTATFSTRAAAYTQEGVNYYPSMGIYAFQGNLRSWNLFENQFVGRASATDAWTYTPFQSWNSGQTYHFFAYAPWHDVTNGNGSMEVINTEGTPRLRYTIADEPSEQKDLLIAIPLHDVAATPERVNLLFHHALTRISFLAQTARPVNSQADLKVIGIRLSGIHNQGTREMDASAGIGWGEATTVGNGGGTYTLTRATSPPKSGGLVDVPLNSLTPTTLTTADGSLFLLPQTLPSGAALEVTFGLFEQGTDTPFDPDGSGPLTAAPTVQSVPLAKVIAEWHPGRHIHFILTLPNPATPEHFVLTYEQAAWDDIDISVDAPVDPFLDITNLAATTYDAAATRLYFHTRIGRGEMLYIDPVGTYPDGSTVTVNNEFVKLANDGLNTPSNLTYSYDPATGTGSGYIDLINHPNGQAAAADNGEQKPITLTLCAGKLRRSLTVTPRISSFAQQKDDQPYIGTFHRADETGERIVTWHTEGDWTATILNTPGTRHADLRMDHMVSPAMMDGSLYTDYALAAEGTLVGDGGRSLSGSGRIYFRVGWSGRTTTNRYAMIRVNYFDRKGVPATTTLYCRQGEKSEPISATAPPFATYNIDTPERWVAYPTQAGALYQWSDGPCPDTYSYPDEAAARALQPTLVPSNLCYGYYADGYFDRRTLTNHRTGNNTPAHPLASGGWLMMNAVNARSLFLPAATGRNASGEWVGEERRGGYWSLLSGEELTAPFAPSDPTKALALLLQVNEPSAAWIAADKRNTLSVRCIRQQGHTLFFDANGGRFRLRSITATGSIALPTEEMVIAATGYAPNLPGNEFGGWKRNPLGNRADVGVTFTPMGDTYLYAHWLTPLIVDYRTMATENTDYRMDIFLQKPTAATSYYGRSASDGATNTTGSSAAIDEKAYPRVRFHGTLSDTPLTFAAGYAYCASLAPQGTWRMPRLSELLSLCYYTIGTASPVFDGKVLWSGTPKGGGTDAFTQHLTGTDFNNASNKQTTHYVRCVQELP